MGRVHLTATRIENAKAPRTGSLFLRDDTLKGFAVRITANKVKSFVLECRINGRVRRRTIGQCDVWTLEKARDRALEWRRAIAEGKDPTIVKEADVTFRDLAERYVEYKNTHGKRSIDEDRRMLAVYIPKGWRTRRLADFSRGEVVKLHTSIGEERGRFSANRVVDLLRHMFNLARDWRLMDADNPASRIQAFKEEKRERFLAPAEVAALSSALEREPDERWRSFWPLALFLGCRVGELLSARWEHVDLEQRIWTKPASTSKSGRSQVLPLPTAAVDIISKLSSRGRSEWLFPSRRNPRGHLWRPQKAWARLVAAAKLENVRPHDVRRTCASWMAASGQSLLMIGKVLNHANPTATSIYARLDVSPVRLAMEQNATALLAAMQKPIEAAISNLPSPTPEARHAKPARARHRVQPRRHRDRHPSAAATPPK